MADSRTERLSRAARARVALRHPRIVPARLVRGDGGRLRIQLQRYSAPTLKDVLSEQELSRRDAIQLVHGTAAAVDALRRSGLVARDLRPSRILVSPTKEVVLADTGIPLELMPRTAPLDSLDSAFCSPEELAGRPIDARSNVFSLGVLLRTTLRASANGSGDVPEAAERVIERATAARPEKRYPSPKDFMIAAAAALDVQVRVRPERNAERLEARPEQVPEPEPAPKPPRQARHRPQRAKPRPVPKEAPPAEPAPSSRAPSDARGRAPEPVAERRSHPVPPRPRLRGRSRPRLRMPRARLPALPRLSLPSMPRLRLNLAGVPRPRPPRLPPRATRGSICVYPRSPVRVCPRSRACASSVWGSRWLPA